MSSNDLGRMTLETFSQTQAVAIHFSEGTIMKTRFARVCLAVLLGITQWAAAQQTLSTNVDGVVPPLVNFNGTLTDLNGKPLTGVVGVTFLLYKDQQGGSPLWLETQNVQPDRTGHYTAMLGSTSSAGLPADIFIAGQAHWLAVQVEGQPEQPRVLLVAVPYALKAGDAQTIGGLPPSAFVLAAPAVTGSGGSTAASSSAAPAVAGLPATSSDVTTTGGAVNTIPLFTTATNVQNSIVTQTGTATISVAGRLNLPATASATASSGANSQPLDFVASSFSSSTSTPIRQTFQWQAEPAANDTANPSGTINLLYGLGATTPSETGLNIASDGQITFATGQIFPGAGTIMGVTAGTDLTGGGTTGTVTLNLDTTKVPQLAAANIFTTNQTVNGTVTATSFSGSGSAMTGVNASELGGLAPTAYAQLAANNTFTGQQTINNTTIMSGTNSFGVLQVTNTATSGAAPAIVGTTDSSAAAGIRGVVTATSGTDAGVVGQTSSPTGSGVQGIASASTGASAGVLGTSASSSGYGVEGINNSGGLAGYFQGTTVMSGKSGSGVLQVTNTATSGAAPAIVGTTDSSAAAGIKGIITATTGTDAGVVGQTSSPTGSGVQGIALASTGTSAGVMGTSDSSSGYGVEGVNTNGGLAGYFQGTTVISGNNNSGVLQVTNTANSGPAPAIVGTTDSSAAAGIKGVITATTGTDAGVLGETSSGAGSGVQGQSPNLGVSGAADGVSSTGADDGTHAGVWGDTGAGCCGFSGVLGTADDNPAGLFFNNGSDAAALTAENYTASSGSLVFLALGLTGDQINDCYITIEANLGCSGTVGTAVPADGGSRMVSLYAMQSAENWFEDAGSGQLSNGSARIALDPTFAQTVNPGVEYHVFLTPKEDCEGLYVSHETPQGFEVHELRGGRSSIAFDYRIMAKRSGYETVRLADVTERDQKTKEQQQLRRGRTQQRRSSPSPAVPVTTAMAQPR
jgi:hypothetical protein